MKTILRVVHVGAALAFLTQGIVAEEIQVLRGPRSKISGLEFSPDGTHLVAIAGREAVLWSIDAKRPVGSVPLPSETGQRSVTWHPASKLFAVWGDFPSVQLYDLRLNAVQSFVDRELVIRETSSVRFSPDGRLLARAFRAASPQVKENLSLSRTSAGIVELVDLHSANVMPLEADQGISSLCFSTDGRTLFGAGVSGSVAAWNVHSGRRMRTEKVVDQGLYSLDLHGRQNLLAVGAAKGNVILLDAKTLKKMPNLKETSGKGGHSVVNAVSFSPDGRRVVQGSIDGVIKLWNVATSEQIAAVEVEPGVRSLAFAPAGDMLLALDTDGGLQILNCPSLQRMQSIAGTTAFTCAPNGKLLATSGLIEGQIVLRSMWEDGRDVGLREKGARN